MCRWGLITGVAHEFCMTEYIILAKTRRIFMIRSRENENDFVIDFIIRYFGTFFLQIRYIWCVVYFQIQCYNIDCIIFV